MCGIIGAVTDRNAVPILMEGLKNKSLGVRQRSLLLFSERLGSRYVS